MPDEGFIRPSAPPTLRELAMVLFRQRGVLVGVFSLVVAATIVYMTVGNQYQARMKILVRRGRVDAPVTAQENAPVDLARMALTDEELNSEVELLQDDDVLRKVVESTGLANQDWLHFLRGHQDPPARIERASRRLATRLQVEPVKKTNLISVSYSSTDPAQAAKVLRTLGNVYLEKHAEVHRPEGESHFFAQQLGDSQSQLEVARNSLLLFNQTHHVVMAAQQRDLTLARLSESDASYRQTIVDLEETKTRVRELERQVATLPERTTTQVRTADNPELLKALKSSLLDLQLKRTQLLDKFEPTHRLVQEAEQQISQAKAAIDGETLSPVRDETTDKNPNFEWAKTELQQDQVRLRGLEERASALNREVVAYREMAQQLSNAASTQDDLIETKKAAQQNYLLYVKKLEEARIDDAMDERGIVNVAIAEHPVAPALPAWSAWALLSVGLLGAVVSGTAAAFAADYLDPAFRTPQDVQLYLRVPVLASLPRKTSAAKRLSHGEGVS